MVMSVGAPALTSAPLEIVELKSRRRDAVLSQLVAAAELTGSVGDADLLLSALQRAQRLGTSAVGHGYAVPHARSLAVARPLVLFGRAARGIDWGPAVEQPVHLVVLVLNPTTTAAHAHAVRVGAAVHALRLQRVRRRMLEAGPEDVRAALIEVFA